MHQPNTALHQRALAEPVKGSSSAAALKLDGTVLTWGANGVGELGDGTTYPANLVPAPVVFDDTASPRISVAVSPDRLWPPTRQQVNVRVLVTAADDIALPTQPISDLTISVNEPGAPPVPVLPGTFVYDGPASGSSDTTVELIAQHGTAGRTRVYTITGAVRDAAGNSTPFSIAIPVAPPPPAAERRP